MRVARRGLLFFREWSKSEKGNSHRFESLALALLNVVGCLNDASIRRDFDEYQRATHREAVGEFAVVHMSFLGRHRWSTQTYAFNHASRIRLTEAFVVLFERSSAHCSLTSSDEVD